MSLKEKNKELYAFLGDKLTSDSDVGVTLTLHQLREIYDALANENEAELAKVRAEASVQNAKNQAVRQAEEGFVEAVLNYRHGDRECKIEFLDEVGLGDYIPGTTWVVNITLDAPYSYGQYDLQSDISSALEDAGFSVDRVSADEGY